MSNRRRLQLFSGPKGPKENEIWYTTTDGQPITPSGLTILSNTYRDGVGKVVTQSRLSEVPARCFRDITTVDTVWLPETVTQINSSAFANSSISEITGYGVSVIKGYTDSFNQGAFENATSLLSAEFPNVVAIERRAFYHCNNLQNFIFDNVESIGVSAFQYCAGLTDVYLPVLTSIQHSAFADSGLVSFAAPNVTSIPEYIDVSRNSIFNGCKDLQEVTLDKVTKIPNQCFISNTKLRTLNIRFELLESIGYRSFENCSSLKININAPILTSLAGQAFKGSGLLSISIPKIKTLSDDGGTIFTVSQLSSVPGLKKVVLEDIETIGYRAFQNDSSLISLVINNTTPPTLGSEAFRGTPSTMSIYVPDSAVDTYKAASGWSSYESRIKPMSELPE